MASTRLGNELENQFSVYTEGFVDFLTRSYFSLALSLMSPNRNENQDWILRSWAFHRRMEETYNNSYQNHLRTFQLVETGSRAPVTFTPKFTEFQTFQTKMMINGPVALEKKAKLLDVLPSELPKIEVENTLKSVAQNQAQQTLEAPRQNAIDRILQDPKAGGFYRRPNGGACGFCMMLASRGPVFSKGTVGFSAHGSCKCSGGAVYKGYKNSPEIQKSADDWLEKNAGKTSKSQKAYNNKKQVDAGIRRKQVDKYVGRDGVERERVTYPLTQKGKEMDAASRIKESKQYSKNKYQARNLPEASPNIQKSDLDSVKETVKANKAAVKESKWEAQDFRPAIFGDY